MNIPDKDNETLKRFLDQVVSLELRVKKSEAQEAIAAMDGFGLKYKNSWGSMELENHTVIEFWRKDLLKSSDRSEKGEQNDVQEH